MEHSSTGKKARKDKGQQVLNITHEDKTYKIKWKRMVHHPLLFVIISWEEKIIHVLDGNANDTIFACFTQVIWKKGRLLEPWLPVLTLQYCC